MRNIIFLSQAELSVCIAICLPFRRRIWLNGEIEFSSAYYGRATYSRGNCGGIGARCRSRTGFYTIPYTGEFGFTIIWISSRRRLNTAPLATCLKGESRLFMRARPNRSPESFVVTRRSHFALRNAVCGKARPCAHKSSRSRLRYPTDRLSWPILFPFPLLSPFRPRCRDVNFVRLYFRRKLPKRRTNDSPGLHTPGLLHCRGRCLNMQRGLLRIYYFYGERARSRSAHK